MLPEACLCGAPAGVLGYKLDAAIPLDPAHSIGLRVGVAGVAHGRCCGCFLSARIVFCFCSAGSPEAKKWEVSTHTMKSAARDLALANAHATGQSLAQTCQSKKFDSAFLHFFDLNFRFIAGVCPCVALVSCAALLRLFIAPSCAKHITNLNVSAQSSFIIMASFNKTMEIWCVCFSQSEREKQTKKREGICACWCVTALLSFLPAFSPRL